MSVKGGQFFNTTKRGEVYELKSDLNSNEEAKKVTAVKKVIAAMTVGKDVSMLFVDVVKCMQTNNVELKKLVYLYLINYAKTMPELAILAVSTFIRDSEDKNPLIRALAIRTMACIRVDQIVEYMTEPLRKCLADTDPYVRKTAAVCVAKLFDMNPDIADDGGFLETLRRLVGDSNPMVVANAVAALAEIQAGSKEAIFVINTEILNNLLAAISECTEWGQVAILDALVSFQPRDSREAQHICERVLPRLSHANPAVVLSATKLVILYMDIITDQEFLKTCTKKLGPPLVSLLSNEPEVQYVALRNVDLIVQKHPDLLRNYIKMFYCKYYDPLYVKVEKIEIMVKLVSARNVEQVLVEFKEYAQEVDVDVVRRAVKAIGRTAIKLPSAAWKCISTLLSLIQVKAGDEAYVSNHVVQEVIVAMKDVFRRYPTQYEAVITDLTASLDLLDDPEAKAAMIWIIGEYAERIDQAADLLSGFLEDWDSEPHAVRLALLTAIVKCYLKRPNESQATVEEVLRVATENTRTPDLRDRAYMYWRLLSSDPEAAKVVVLSEKPVIQDEGENLPPNVLSTLLRSMAQLSSVYHKPAELFLNGHYEAIVPEEPQEDEDGYQMDPELAAKVLASKGGEIPAPLVDAGAATAEAAAPAPAPAPKKQNLMDLLDLGGGGGDPALPSGGTPSGGNTDLMSLINGTPSTPTSGEGVGGDVSEWLSAQQGKGLLINGRFVMQSGGVVMEYQLENQSMGPMSGFAVQLNKNSFGLTPGQPLSQVGSLPPGGKATMQIPLRASPEMFKMMSPVNALQVAIKTNVDVLYFQALYPLWAVFTAAGEIERGPFLELWKNIPDNAQSATTFNFSLPPANDVAARLRGAHVYMVALKQFEDPNTREAKELAYFSAKTANDIPVLFEVTFSPGKQAVAVKTQPAIADLAKEALYGLLAR